MKKYISLLFIVIISTNVYSAEPATNIGRSYSLMMAEWPDLHYLNTEQGIKVYGVQDDDAYYFFKFENEKVVEECLIVQTINGFAREWYNSSLASFYKTSYKSVTRTSNGYKFQYSFFSVKVTYFSDYTGNTCMIIYEKN